MGGQGGGSRYAKVDGRISSGWENKRFDGGSGCHGRTAEVDYDPSG